VYVRGVASTRDARFELRVTPKQLARWKRAARRIDRKQHMSEWLRRVCDAAANAVLDPSPSAKAKAPLNDIEMETIVDEMKRVAIRIECEICEDTVKSDAAHWKVTKARPDGFWSCHPDLGKLRCSECRHLWKPRSNKDKISPCPCCGETENVFHADDGGWEEIAKSKARDAGNRTSIRLGLGDDE